MYLVKDYVSDHKRFIKQLINSQIIYQPICQLKNQVLHNLHADKLFTKPFISYTNHVAVNDESFVPLYQLFINYLVLNHISTDKTCTRYQVIYQITNILSNNVLTHKICIN